jgi:HlyD family secretion protein
MTANVSITIAQRTGVVKMPNAAMRFRPADATPGAMAMQRGPGAPAGASGEQGGGGGGGMNAAGAEGGGRGSRGGRSGAGGEGPRRRPRGDVTPVRTIYTLSSTNAPATEKPQARQVKLGISDGAFTEVTDGLKEGDVVVTGSNATDVPAGPQRPSGPSNPFGGGRRF